MMLQVVAASWTFWCGREGNPVGRVRRSVVMGGKGGNAVVVGCMMLCEDKVRPPAALQSSYLLLTACNQATLLSEFAHKQTYGHFHIQHLIPPSHTSVCAGACTRTHTYTHTHTHTGNHTHMQTHTRAHARSCAHTQTPKHV
jgi:hypothetical protein